VAVCVAVLGCATKFPPYEPREFESYPRKQESNGLRVAIDPMQDPAEVKRYFGIDLIKTRILPVFVVAENRSEASSFILDPDVFQLGERTSSSVHHPDRRAIDNTWAAVVGVVAFTPAGLAWNLQMGRSSVVNYNFETKRLRRTTLSPGETTHGFIYFGIPDDPAVAARIKAIAAEASELPGTTAVRFELPCRLAE
jgi:hypothetical protein